MSLFSASNPEKTSLLLCVLTQSARCNLPQIYGGSILILFLVVARPAHLSSLIQALFSFFSLVGFFNQRGREKQGVKNWIATFDSHFEAYSKFCPDLWKPIGRMSSSLDTPSSCSNKHNRTSRELKLFLISYLSNSSRSDR